MAISMVFGGLRFKAALQPAVGHQEPEGRKTKKGKGRKERGSKERGSKEMKWERTKRQRDKKGNLFCIRPGARGARRRRAAGPGVAWLFLVPYSARSLASDATVVARRVRSGCGPSSSPANNGLQRRWLLDESARAGTSRESLLASCCWNFYPARASGTQSPPPPAAMASTCADPAMPLTPGHAFSGKH